MIGLSYFINEKKFRNLTFVFVVGRQGRVARSLGKPISFGINKTWVQILAVNFKGHITLYMYLNPQLLCFLQSDGCHYTYLARLLLESDLAHKVPVVLSKCLINSSC